MRNQTTGKPRSWLQGPSAFGFGSRCPPFTFSLLVSPISPSATPLPSSQPLLQCSKVCPLHRMKKRLKRIKPHTEQKSIKSGVCVATWLQVTSILKKGAVHKTGLIWIVWTAWEIFQVLRWSWKVCIKTWQVWFWLQDDKVLSQSDELHSRSWDHIKWIWQSLASYLTIKSDKKSSQQQAHELYPFLSSCSLSLSLSPNSNSEHFFLPIF